MPTRARVLSLLKRYGWNATSFQTLESEFEYWFEGEDACIAYVDTGTAWVAAGAPICAPERLTVVAEAFIAAARANRRRVCFFGAEERLRSRVPLRSLTIGEQPLWNPQMWIQSLRRSSSLREQLRRARAKGVRVRRLGTEELGDDSPVRRQLERLTVRWLAARPMPPMGFLVQLEPFGFFDERRSFVAEWQGRTVGMLTSIPVYGRMGWFLEDLVRDAVAPNGTSELLVDAAMREIAKEGSGFATLGLAPLSGPVGGFLRWARTWGRGLYDFQGLRAFKAKLQPDRWEPIYLLYPSRQSRVLTLVDALRAFAGGGLLKFAWRALGRGPALLPQVLAGLLIPWTAVLASPVAARFFPTRGVQLAWAAFDAVLAAALFALAGRWRRWLGRALASVVSLDAALTAIEVGLFNARHVIATGEAVICVLAVTAPLLAAILLWRAQAHAEKVREDDATSSRISR